MSAADTFGLVGIPDCIFDAVGRRGRVGIFGASISGKVRLIVAPVPGFHPLAYHASATPSRGKSHPSPFVDLSPQYFPNAWRHTVCVHGDGEKAVAFVRRIRSQLEAEGVEIAPLADVIA